jgi:16S rRNA (cytosine1402-N4)-methyltransferase
MGEAILNNNEECFMPPLPVNSSISLRDGPGYHIPVLFEETVRALAVKPEGTYVDCTVGGGGHFQALLDKLNAQGRAIGIDRDPDAIAWCDAHLDRKGVAVVLKQGRFSALGDVLDGLHIDAVDGVLLDLGVSSHQIRDEKRGFSYMKEAGLDMRMDPAGATTAADILRESTVQQLAGILAQYGEIRNPMRMAETIKTCMKHTALKTSGDLKDCLQKEYGGAMKIKVLAKLFQALRIAVNDELSELGRCCEQAVSRLRQGGRLVVISYHSLEDRIVKNFMRDAEKGCVCPPGIPVCMCGGKKTLKRIITRAIVSSPDEIKRNPASRSARLRVAEKINPVSYGGR